LSSATSSTAPVRPRAAAARARARRAQTSAGPAGRARPSHLSRAPARPRRARPGRRAPRRRARRARAAAAAARAAAVAAFAHLHKITIAVVGPEGPLEAGVADALWAIGVRCVGPKQKLAQLESSKAFTRNLLIDNAIGACPRYKVATTLAECQAFFELVGPLMYVVKADGLCGGKGVKVGGEHLASDEESLEFCR
jgi:phosphoribosylamine-glycine ligase